MDIDNTITRMSSAQAKALLGIICRENPSAHARLQAALKDLQEQKRANRVMEYQKLRISCFFFRILGMAVLFGHMAAQLLFGDLATTVGVYGLSNGHNRGHALSSILYLGLFAIFYSTARIYGGSVVAKPTGACDQASKLEFIEATFRNLEYGTKNIPIQDWIPRKTTQKKMMEFAMFTMEQEIVPGEMFSRLEQNTWLGTLSSFAIYLAFETYIDRCKYDAEPLNSTKFGLMMYTGFQAITLAFISELGYGFAWRSKLRTISEEIQAKVISLQAEDVDRSIGLQTWWKENLTRRVSEEVKREKEL